jgi:hypothetical protein
MGLGLHKRCAVKRLYGNRQKKSFFDNTNVFDIMTESLLNFRVR